jgi:predicted nucleotidyltransferase
MFNIISNKLIIKADFIVKKDSDYRRLEFSRRKPVELDGQKIYIVSIEDLILSKLVWGKDSDSEFQLRDITNLLDSAEKLDWEYLEKWATKLNVKNYLRKANSDE